jgi:hypothetical protein
MNKVLILLVVLMMVGSASAAWFNHYTPTGNDLWSSDGNWNLSTPPVGDGSDGLTLFPNNGTGGLCQVDETAIINSLAFAGTGTIELEILSTGDLTLTNNQTWPTFGGIAGRTHILTMSGGSFDVQLPANQWFAFGNTGTGILNMNDGLLTTDNLRIDWDVAGGSGQAYVTGGVIDLNGFLRIGTTGLLDITGGQIISRGKDDTTVLQGYVTSGQITGATVSDVYFDGTDTYIVPEPATMLLLGLGGLLLRKRR